MKARRREGTASPASPSTLSRGCRAASRVARCAKAAKCANQSTVRPAAAPARAISIAGHANARAAMRVQAQAITAAAKDDRIHRGQRPSFAYSDFVNEFISNLRTIGNDATPEKNRSLFVKYNFLLFLAQAQYQLIGHGGAIV